MIDTPTLQALRAGGWTVDTEEQAARAAAAVYDLPLPRARLMIRVDQGGPGDFIEVPGAQPA